MGSDREALRWEASWALAVGAVTIGLLLGFAPAVLASFTDGATMLGLPAGYFLGGLLVPIVLVAAIFWFARSQGQLDRRFDATGE